MVGDFNVSFTCEYAWPAAAGNGRSFVSTEKTLKSNLLGSDTVAGVPIALASFIVPGLVFWLVLGWMKVPWSVGPALGDKLIYSVIVSVALLWLISWWKTDSSGAIGLSKLFWFAATGGVAGVVTGSLDHLRRSLLKRRKDRQDAIADAAQAKVGDEPKELLRKLLAKYPQGRKPRAVVKDGSTQYTGSLMEETDEIVAIIGWFRIVKDDIPPANRAAVVDELARATLPSEIFNVAIKYGLTIEPRNGIRQIINGEESEGPEVLPIKRRGVIAEQHWDTDEDEVIVVESNHRCQPEGLHQEINRLMSSVSLATVPISSVYFATVLRTRNSVFPASHAHLSVSHLTTCPLFHRSGWEDFRAKAF
jgi:hypothetical protein